jgi:hypothetical protein
MLFSMLNVLYFYISTFRSTCQNKVLKHFAVRFVSWNIHGLELLRNARYQSISSKTSSCLQSRGSMRLTTLPRKFQFLFRACITPLTRNTHTQLHIYWCSMSTGLSLSLALQNGNMQIGSERETKWQWLIWFLLRLLHSQVAVMWEGCNKSCYFCCSR